MKRYNRWFNLITSIVVDVFVGLFFVFAARPCVWENVNYSCTYMGCYSYRVYYNLFENHYGCCTATSLCLIALAVLSTASLVMDILHAAGPFKENRAYRIIHLCFSLTCFGLAVTCVPCISVISFHCHPLAPLYCCLSFACVLTVVEGARFVMGCFAGAKARRISERSEPAPKQVKYNSDYAVKKLKDLKELFNEGIISEEEYNEAKKKYVKDL